MKPFWTIRAAANKVGDVMLYGPISETSWRGDEATPKQFKKDLDALGDVSTLNIYINSGGGDVFAGQAIYSMLKRHKAEKTVYVDGLAASIASLIAMAGDTVVMPKNAMLMVHNPWTWAVGNANDFRAIADDMDKIREAMIPVYRDKTGLSDEEIIALLDAETWLTAEEAKEKGFCDEIEDEKKLAASLHDEKLLINGMSLDVSRFFNFPKSAFPEEPAATGSLVPLEIYETLVRNNERRAKK